MRLALTAAEAKSDFPLKRGSITHSPEIFKTLMKSPRI
jgi:hypothetical protein